MANEKHRRLLKEGVKAWNTWRDENPGIEPDLYKAKLSRANLSGANLSYARLVKTDLRNTNLTGCRIYGISAWDNETTEAKQLNLIITPEEETVITVDDLEVAQFIYRAISASSCPCTSYMDYPWYIRDREQCNGFLHLGQQRHMGEGRRNGGRPAHRL